MKIYEGQKGAGGRGSFHNRPKAFPVAFFLNTEIETENYCQFVRSKK
jgi:hypothetical protein